MAGPEEALKQIEPVLRRLWFFSLLGKKVEVRQEKNFVREGPNIIVGNHCGAFKDVAVIFKIAPRPIFFTANKDIFTKAEFDRLILKHLQRHLKDFGLVVNAILKPLKYYFVRYVSTNIGKIGTIPVDMHTSKREALMLSQEYLKMGRAVIALQGRGRVQPHDRHPYVSPFKRGAPILAYNLFCDHNILVPVTPLAMFGTQTPFLIPAKILINVGEPMYITDYLGSGYGDSIDKFRNALETRVKTLFRDLIRA